jgi:glutathione S-transferase
MKLYYSKGACSLAVRIVINEIGLQSEYEAVNLQDKKTASGDDFFKINSKGAVPALVTDDKHLLTENAVIQQYLADTNKAHQLLPPVGDFKRYEVLEWLNFVGTELHKGFGPLFSQIVPAELKNEIFIPVLKKKFAFLEQQLEKHKYIAGDHFALPDAYLFVILTWANAMGIDLNDCPAVMRHFAVLKLRASIQKSLQEEEL